MFGSSDPKPGRWLLPIVIVAMVGFTWVFVNTVDQGSVPGATTTVASGPSDDGGDGTTTTTMIGEPPQGVTTTTIPAEVAAYLTVLESLSNRADALLTEGRDINRQWDEREINYATADQRMVALEQDCGVFAADFDAATPQDLPFLQAAHIEATIAARAMAEAATNMLTGLREPGTSVGRLAALDEYQAAAAELSVAVERIKIEAAGGAPAGTSTTLPQDT